MIIKITCTKRSNKMSVINKCLVNSTVISILNLSSQPIIDLKIRSKFNINNLMAGKMI